MEKTPEPIYVVRGPCFDRDLKWLCDEWGMSESDVIRTCVGNTASQEGCDVRDPRPRPPHPFTPKG